MKKMMTFTSLFIAVLFSSAIALAQMVPYSNRPDIFNVPAQELPYHLGNAAGAHWSGMLEAHFDAVAFILEAYSNREVYFLARDSELLYDAARLATNGAANMHLLNVSRVNMEDALLPQYLARHGIDKYSLGQSEGVVMIDTGFVGSIPNKIKTLFPAHLASKIHTHLLVSNTGAIPSMRTFLQRLNFDAAYSNDVQTLHGAITQYEHMPRYSERSTEFQYFNGNVEAMAAATGNSDGQVNPELAIKYMSSLRYAYNKNDMVLRFMPG